MRTKLRAVVLAGVLLLAFGVQAEPIQLSIATGSEAGTYYQFGQDMRKLAAQHDIDLTVLPSRGSVENMVAIFDSRSIQLGLAQSDVLLFMNLLGDAKARAIAQEIKVALPLYDEEVHLLASTDIKQLGDLNGKKVAIGRDGSGTMMTANLIFAVAEVEPAEKLALGGPEALTALRKGDIDAMFFVAGFPVKLFTDEISKDDALQLVPLNDAMIKETFGTSKTIPADAYAWQQEAVETITVKAGLMTLNYDNDNVNCGYIGRFALMIRDNLDWLKQNGHPKWQSVDLDAPVNPQLQSACALLVP